MLVAQPKSQPLSLLEWWGSITDVTAMAFSNFGTLRVPPAQAAKAFLSVNTAKRNPSGQLHLLQAKSIGMIRCCA